MNQEMRKSVAAKVAAIGFVINILLGNYWMIRVIMGQKVPGWFFDLFLLVSLAILASAVWLILMKARGAASTETDQKTSEDSFAE